MMVTKVKMVKELISALGCALMAEEDLLAGLSCGVGAPQQRGSRSQVSRWHSVAAGMGCEGRVRRVG